MIPGGMVYTTVDVAQPLPKPLKGVNRMVSTIGGCCTSIFFIHG
jgi:hypothetical protein